MDLKILLKYLPICVLLLLCNSYGFSTSSVEPIEIVPIEKGPYLVGTTNVEVAAKYTSIGDEAMEAYLSGDAGTLEFIQYVTDILKHPKSAWVVNVMIPNEPEMYGPVSGMTLPVLAYIAYPTIIEQHPNSYTFPYHNGAYGHFENMLDAGELPKFAESNKRYPLIVDSHGYTAHGFYDVGRVHELASQGYIVAVINYGDKRAQVPDSKNHHVAFLRPLFTKAVIDSLLNSEAFGPNIDSNNIGMAGYSLGGTTALAMSGGKLFGKSAAVTDTRIKANVIAAPWVGGDDVMAFGQDSFALTNVVAPTLTLIATNDEIAKPTFILQAVKQLNGPTYVVDLIGQGHGFEPGSWVDRKNWEALFFAAYLKNDAAAMKLLKSGRSMKGGNIDIQRLRYQTDKN